MLYPELCDLDITLCFRVYVSPFYTEPVIVTSFFSCRFFYRQYTSGILLQSITTSVRISQCAEIINESVSFEM